MERKSHCVLIKSHPDGWGTMRAIGRKKRNTKPCRLRLCRILKLVLRPYVNKFPMVTAPTSNALRASRHFGKKPNSLSLGKNASLWKTMRRKGSDDIAAYRTCGGRAAMTSLHTEHADEGQQWHRYMDECFFSLGITEGMGANWRRGRIRRRE